MQKIKLFMSNAKDPKDLQDIETRLNEFIIKNNINNITNISFSVLPEQETKYNKILCTLLYEVYE